MKNFLKENLDLSKKNLTKIGVGAISFVVTSLLIDAGLTMLEKKGSSKEEA